MSLRVNASVKLSVVNYLFLIQGVILVYDITNRWSFDGIDRWIKEIDEVRYDPRASLVGNR